MFIIILILVTFGSLLYLPGPGGFESPKVALLLIGSAAMLLLWWQRRALTIRRPKTSLALLAIMAYLILRNLLVAAPNYAWLGTENSHFGVIAWLAWLIILLVTINLEFSDQQKNQLRLANLISLVGMMLIVAIQQLGWDHTSWYSFDDPARGRTLIGSIGGSGQLGIFLLLFTIVVLTTVKQKNISRGRKYLTYLAAISAIILIIISKSISAWLGLGLVILLLIPHLKQWLGKFFWLTSLIILLLLPIFFITSIGVRLADKIAPSLADRVVIWQSAYQSLSDPTVLIFGSGVNQFQTVYDQHFPPARVSAREVTEEYPHSLVWQLLVEWGLIGLALVVAAVWFFAQESKLTNEWLALALLIWLAMIQVNALTATFWTILLALLVLGWSAQATAQSRPLNIGWRIILLTLATGWLLVTALTTNSSWALSWQGHQGDAASGQYDFGHAVGYYKHSADIPLASSFAKLQLAESMTNLDIKQKNFTQADAVKVDQLLSSSLKGAGTAKNSDIALNIMAVWLPFSTDILHRYDETGLDFLQQWPNHPKHQNLVQALRGQVN